LYTEFCIELDTQSSTEFCTVLKNIVSNTEYHTEIDTEPHTELCIELDIEIERINDSNAESKVKTIKETYFPKTKRDTVISESDSPIQAEPLVEGAMSHYVSALANPLSFKR
jgi:hypothetical protein